MKLNDVVPIHCIGDSHVSVFGGIDIISEGFPSSFDKLSEFKTYRVGPVLAYNMITEGHKGRLDFFGILQHIKKGSWVLLSFGEIDCRAHLMKQKEKQNLSIEDVVKNCVNRYFQFVLEVKRLGYNVIVYAVPPTSNHDVFEDLEEQEMFPHYGSFVERNYATKYFNNLLNTKCIENNVLFLSIFNLLLSEEGKTNESFFCDCIHLSYKTLPNIVFELEKILENYKA